MPANEIVVPTSKIAEIIGRTEQRVNQLAKEGVLVKRATGKWDLVQTLKAYIAYLENARGGDEGLEMQKIQAEVDYKRAKADTAQLELEELKGNMIRAEDVEDVMTDHVYVIRSMLIALPGRLAINVLSASTPAESSEIIRKEVYGILEELSNYKFDPAEYAKRVRERQGWRERDENNDSKETEESD